MPLHEIYLLLGSNIGDRAKHIQNGLKKIESDAGAVQRTSSYYETEPWGVEDQSDYLNVAVLITSSLSPSDLFNVLKQIETEEGRIDPQKYAPRTLDIDILFYDDLVLKTHDLIIPHPRLHLRRFVLVPMKEIANDVVHPVLKKTIRQLSDECEDDKKVWEFK